MRRIEKKIPYHNKAFPILLFIATIFMGIGYAALTSISLNITGMISTQSQKGVYITDVSYLTDVDADIENCYINDFYQTVVNSSISLSETDPYSEITYAITVFNSTNEDYYFRGVSYIEDETTYSNPDITFTVIDINENTVLKSQSSLTFGITFFYIDNVRISDNTLNSYLSFDFKNIYNISYNNLLNYTSYPTEIFNGETLTIDLSSSNITNVNIYMDGVEFFDFSFENNILTINNVTSNLTIQGSSSEHYDIPITDTDTDFVVIDTSDSDSFNVENLFELQLVGVNGSSKKITKIELIVTYTSTTGSNQSIISRLTHNNIEYERTLEFQGKIDNGELVISFDNLSIEIYEPFTITNTNNKLTNKSITIHSEEVKVYFE